MKAAYCKIRIERKSCLCGCSRLVHLAKPRENSRELEMRDGVVSVCLKAAAQPGKCFDVGVERHLGNANPRDPTVGIRVARGKAQRLVDVSFGFCEATEKKLEQRGF